MENRSWDEPWDLQGIHWEPDERRLPRLPVVLGTWLVVLFVMFAFLVSVVGYALGEAMTTFFTELGKAFTWLQGDPPH